MCQEFSRRSVFSLLGATTTVFVSGCFGSAYNPPPGSLMLSNEDNQSHTVTITVAGDEDTWSKEFTIPAGKTRKDEDFISQSGDYTVTVKSAAGDTSETKVSLTPSSASSVGMTGHSMEVWVSEDGGVSIVSGIYD